MRLNCFLTIFKRRSRYNSFYSVIFKLGIPEKIFNVRFVSVPWWAGRKSFREARELRTEDAGEETLELSRRKCSCRPSIEMDFQTLKYVNQPTFLSM